MDNSENRFSEQTAHRFEQHYSAPALRTKLRRIATTVGRKVLVPALQLFYLLQSPQVPLKAKTLIVGALGYLILPADLVPDFIPLLGFTDDLTALLLALRTSSQYLTPEITARARQEADRLIGE